MDAFAFLWCLTLTGLHICSSCIYILLGSFLSHITHVVLFCNFTEHTLVCLFSKPTFINSLILVCVSFSDVLLANPRLKGPLTALVQ